MMVDVFISYSQRERSLMLPIKQRLEALGLILFVDVDGRLDGEATFPEALDKGVRASKAVLGCWTPWALTRRWVNNECSLGLQANKLVAIERAALSFDDVPLEFINVDRKPLADFDGTEPHEGWAMTLNALATKLKLWVERQPENVEAAAVLAKIKVLERAAAAERERLGSPLLSVSVGQKPNLASDAAERAWNAIERSLEISHYARFERTFEFDPNAFARVIEADARSKALERWAATDKKNVAAIADAIRTGFFPALQAEAEKALAAAKQVDCSVPPTAPTTSSERIQDADALIIIREDIEHTDTDTCVHPGCVAFRRLLDHGAAIRKIVSGRRCEIAMLAAAGSQGLTDARLVQARRHLARHLREPLPGSKIQPIADADHAVHADHAAQGSDVNNPINLGNCQVRKTRGRLDVWAATDHYVLDFLPMESILKLVSAPSRRHVRPEAVDLDAGPFRSDVAAFERDALRINPKAPRRARSVAIFRFALQNGWTPGKILKADIDYMPYPREATAVDCCENTVRDAHIYDLRGQI